MSDLTVGQILADYHPLRLRCLKAEDRVAELEALLREARGHVAHNPWLTITTKAEATARRRDFIARLDAALAEPSGE